MYLEHSRTSAIKPFYKKWQFLQKDAIVDVQLGSKYTSEITIKLAMKK